MTGVEGYPYPVASGSNDMFGGGGLSALLIGSLLFGGGMGGFGNRGLGWWEEFVVHDWRW